MIRPLPKGIIAQDERGAALVSSLLILLLLTVLASGGYWLSRGELAAAQGYSQSVRALYLADAGMARFFVANTSPNVSDMSFEAYPDPCADTIAYPTTALQNACYLASDTEAETLLEELSIDMAPAQAYAFTNANVYVTSEFLLTDGQSPIYEVTAEARVQDVGNPDVWTTRAVSHFAAVLPPFSITSVFAATGGINFGGGNDDHYHFDGQAQASKTGSCGSEIDLDNMQVPRGQFDLPKPVSECPGGKGCPYKWHMGTGDGLDVDSASVTGAGIVTDMGISWSDFLDDGFFTGITDVISFNDSNDFMDYFDDSKSKTFQAMASWPITRYFGDLTSDQKIKGYGVLIVDGDLILVNETFEWTGIMLVGGTINTSGNAHIHVKGAAVAGLGCTDAERAAGSCRSNLDGVHSDMKYRPCEISQAWSRLLKFQPMDDLFRESGPIG